MLSKTPINPPAHYATPTAIGYADSDGDLALVTGAAPLPVAVLRSAQTPTTLAGEAAAATVAGPFVPLRDVPIHLQLKGQWSGTVTLERSVDGGVTRHPLTAAGLPWARYTGNVNEVVWQEGEAGATIWLSLAVESGVLSYRVSQ